MCTLHAAHDITSMKTMPSGGRANSQLHCVQILVLIRPTVPEIQPFLYPHPIAVQTHCQNVNLLICFTRYTTHGLPSTSSCTTPYIQLGCQQPDARVLPIQVPVWDLDQNLQDQGWGKTWLSALHPGQRGLCCHGQMDTSRWSTQKTPNEVLRLHREHIRWWDLPTSLCLWARRHHKEVW